LNGAPALEPTSPRRSIALAPTNKNVAARPNDVPLRQNSHFIDQCGRSILYGFSGRIESMIIATVLFIAFVVGTGAAIVKAYEWHQDVLYGPYLKRVD
jgi:hypothetical protein